MNPDITLPKPLKVRIYAAQITQIGTNAPTAEIQQNTLGYNIIWTREIAGGYVGTLGEYITDEQINLTIAGNLWDKNYCIRRGTSNTVQIFTGNVVTATLQDGQLNKTPIKIEIYNI